MRRVFANSRSVAMNRASIGEDEFGGLESFPRCFAREGLGVGDEISMQRRRQLDLVIFTGLSSSSRRASASP